MFDNTVFLKIHVHIIYRIFNKILKLYYLMKFENLLISYYIKLLINCIINFNLYLFKI